MIQISDHPEREHSHGQFHAGAVAHHPHLRHRQLLQRHVRIHAGEMMLTTINTSPSIYRLRFTLGKQP